MTLVITYDENRIYCKNKKEDGFGYTDYTLEVWSKISSNWYVSQENLDKGSKTYIYTMNFFVYTSLNFSKPF